MKQSRRSFLTLAGIVPIAGIAGGVGYAMSRSDIPKPDDSPGTSAASPEATPAATPVGNTAVTITFGDIVVSGELWDNPTAQDLISLLPLDLTFSDYNAVEKTARLPRALTMDGIPAGDDPEPGEIGYYAPGNVLVLYYGDIGYWNGIVRLGRMLENVDQIVAQSADFAARIDLAV
ncbi:MAG: cyclophilin-like fold protein [Thermomicrobiales bacterium]|nr:cyclophilin-like fold protein [Thermomicrobiales bacterium]MCO5219165.1 cyclophilin-like fold protein [Thermomicrobiales bacterium]MCO5225853.1 cyclophilin-like fold protein [Thermomicrobiales bacterium]MCO5228077.1 cyclophilin-like fold protein [Thermomicrobiales bacterium]